MKKALTFCLLSFFFIFSPINSFGYSPDRLSFSNKADISIEIAETPSELRRGLMYREGLSPNSGMLFIFEYEDKYGFWMKNMKFPIDIIWIDSDLKVVDIKKNAEPCIEEPCETYYPSDRARYVLEVPAGYFEERSIRIGDRGVFDLRNSDRNQ